LISLRIREYISSILEISQGILSFGTNKHLLLELKLIRASQLYMACPFSFWMILKCMKIVLCDQGKFASQLRQLRTGRPIRCTFNLLEGPRQLR